MELLGSYSLLNRFWKEYSCKFILAPGQAPQNVGAEICGYGCINIFWEGINTTYIFGSLIGYYVRLRPETSPDEQKWIDNTTETLSMTVKGLRHATIYYISVAGKTHDGIGIFSKEIKAVTKAGMWFYYFAKF